MLSATQLMHGSADILLIGAIIGCVYLLMAALLVAIFERRATVAPAANTAPVTVLVPLCGDEPGLADRLTALCRQDYPAPVQVICGLQRDDDPALATVQAIAASEPALECHVDGRLHGRNLKVSNLINMARHARHDTFILVDSDVEVGRDFVGAMVATLQQPDVGAVTCLYHSVSAGGLWAELASQRTNAHFLPSVIVALRYGLAEPCFGAGLALARTTLERVGGFQAFADQIWDDYAIGEAVRALGHTVALSDFTLGHVVADGSARDFFAAELRAARTIRSLDPEGHAGSVITHPFALALIALLLGAGSPAVVVMLSALACRMAVCRGVEQRFGTRATSYLLLPLRDVLSFAVHVASFFGSTVTWRGQRYRLSDRSLVTDPGSV